MVPTFQRRPEFSKMICVSLWWYVRPTSYEQMFHLRKGKYVGVVLTLSLNGLY
jgi:hypothetical protein